MLANQLPNQQYYAQFQGKGSEHVFHMVSGILFYGFMEFVSFVMLEVVLVRQLGTSGIVQLAFLLQKQVDGVQTKLLFWVFYFSQAAVQHLGAFILVLLQLHGTIVNNTISCMDCYRL